MLFFSSSLSHTHVETKKHRQEDISASASQPASSNRSAPTSNRFSGFHSTRIFCSSWPREVSLTKRRRFCNRNDPQHCCSSSKKKQRFLESLDRLCSAAECTFSVSSLLFFTPRWWWWWWWWPQEGGLILCSSFAGTPLMLFCMCVCVCFPCQGSYRV